MRRSRRSTIRRVFGAATSDLGLVAVADGKQHVFGEVQIAALFTVVLVNVRFDDRVHRAAFFTEAAEDALGQVDVVARRAARTVLADLRLDRDGLSGADGLAKLTGWGQIRLPRKDGRDATYRYIAPRRSGTVSARALLGIAATGDPSRTGT